jgi:hypothetical protein
MELESLRRGRRILSAAVSLTAIALVMAKVSGAVAGGGGGAVGLMASVAFIVSFALLVVVWRKEHVASEAAFAARAGRELASMKLALELARKKQAEQGKTAAASSGKTRQVRG